MPAAACWLTIASVAVADAVALFLLENTRCCDVTAAVVCAAERLDHEQISQ
jgi:hypothetical protein